MCVKVRKRPEDNYSKYKKLKNDLVQVQKRLSKMDIVEWHEITGTLHPANHVMDKVGVIRGHIQGILPFIFDHLGQIISYNFSYH